MTRIGKVSPSVRRAAAGTVFPGLLALSIAAGLAVSEPAALAQASMSAAMPTDAQLAEQRRRNSIALHAKLLCSGVFVSGREAEEIIKNDLGWSEYTFHDWATTRWTVDGERQRVTLWSPASGDAPETPRYVAQHNPGFGCTLLPEGAERVAFEPRVARDDGPDAAGLDWPAGAGNAEGDSADPAGIEAMLDFAFDDSRQDPPQHTRALIVLHHGRIVAERYAPGFDRDMPLIGWSMGKSVGGALFGVLVHETGLDIDAPAPVGEWSGPGDPRGAITPRQLMNMAGGLKFHNPGVGSSYYYSDIHEHESVYFRGQNTERLVLSRPLQYAPGTVFQYRNANTLTLMSIIKRANLRMGRDPMLWPREALFDRIGARSFTLEPDAYGNFVITGNDYATARDWARLGQFVLQDGVWGGERLWPEGWLETMSTPSPAEPNYGGQIWLNTEDWYPSAPADAIFFRGWLNQIVMIVPSEDLVIVRLGHSDAGGFDPYFDDVVRLTLDAVDR